MSIAMPHRPRYAPPPPSSMTSRSMPEEPTRAPRRAPRPAPRDLRPGEPLERLAIASSIFGMVALVAIWAVVQMLYLSGLSESRSQGMLYAQLRADLAAGTVPTGGAIKPGTPVALLTIPALGLEQVVVEGTASGDLEHGPGHLRATPLPGTQGVSWVMGRATTYGGPFGQISHLVPGDQIKVLNQQGPVLYKVLDVRRTGDPVPALPTGSQSLLTLVTAEGSGTFGGLTANSVVYVDALAQKAYPAAAHTLEEPASEKPMGRDTSALPLLVLCLAALGALTLAVAAARRQVRGVLVWIVAVPAVLALAWATTDVAVRLLPNLL